MSNHDVLGLAMYRILLLSLYSTYIGVSQYLLYLLISSTTWCVYIYIYSIAIYTYIQYIHLYSKLTCDDFIHRPVSLKNCRYPQASRLSNASISPSFFRGYAINWTVCIKNVLKSTHVYSLQGGSPQLCSFMSNPVRYRYVQHMFPFHPG